MKQRSAGGFLWLLLVVLSSPVDAQISTEPRVALLPPDSLVVGWSRADSPRMFKGEDLFSYIDGGAVLFFEYGFNEVLAAEFQDPEGESMNVEIYTMKDPGAAYGIYSVRSSERATTVAIGQEGSAQPYYIMFWKGDYYVTVAASDSNSRCRAGLEAFAREIDRRITNNGERPALVGLLPEDRLLKTRYVRGPLGLSTLYPFDPSDSLRTSEAVVGIYADHTLFLFEYGTSTEARDCFSGFGQSLITGHRFTDYRFDQGFITVSDRKSRVLCITRMDRYIIISLSPSATTALATGKKTVSAWKSR